MIHRSSGLILVVITIIGIVALIDGADANAQLVLSEVLADPVSDWDGSGEVHYRDDEWVEVTNVGEDIVDLSLFVLRDALGADPHLRLAGSLLPGEAAVFHGSDAVAWQQAENLPITGLSLNNGGDQVELLIGYPGEPDLQLVDILIYLDHEAEDDRASGRLPDGGTWALFDGLNPYEGTTPPLGTGCEPDPGLVNDCVPLVPTTPATWGGVRALFR